MKAFSDDGAHPTQFDGKPVTFEIAKEIAGTTLQRIKRSRRRVPIPTTNEVEALQTNAESAVLGLWEMRKEQGVQSEDSILFSNS
ncbi:MAG: hypothetical protein EOP45_13850 [Sphingobacteriaceae bacterium]|nr:MAG: hypothetical protein EOP45_13850 [Sphingobacteriaceae bacterium]